MKEFWIVLKGYHQVYTQTDLDLAENPTYITENGFKVREVVAIDWAKVWLAIEQDKYTQHVDQPTKFMVQQLVEDQLAGDE